MKEIVLNKKAIEEIIKEWVESNPNIKVDMCSLKIVDDYTGPRGSKTIVCKINY